MALEINLVNLGTYPNDGAGDDLRTAFEKSNANFASLEENVVLSAANLGSGAPFYSDKLGNDLRFRTIRSEDANLSVSYDSYEIVLQVKDFLEFVEEDTAPKLGGNLDLNDFEINGAGDIDIDGVVIADGFEGVLLGTVFGDLFGSVFGNVTGNVTGQVSDISNHNLEDLANVSSETPDTNASLIWDGTFWKPKYLSLNDLSNLNVSSPALGEVLSWNGSVWSPAATVTKIVPGNNITISPENGTGEVTVNAVVDPIPTDLNDLTDVSISTPEEGQVLQYNGTSWVNSNFSGSNLDLTLYDFGLLSGVRNQLDLLFQFTNIDFGTISSPSSVNFNLGAIGGTPPTETVYQLSASLSTVTEGGSVTITLTTNAANGTVVPYQISGVSSNDINGTSLTGSFVVSGGEDSVTIPITIDLVNETETLTLGLVGISPAVSVSVIIQNFTLPDTADGGTPSVVSFSAIFEGGVPNTSSFVIDLDGGTVSGLGVLPAIIDGGEPITVHTVILDGESPTSPVTTIADGETIL